MTKEEIEQLQALIERHERHLLGLDQRPPPTRKGACPKCGPSIVCTCIAS